MKLVVTENDRQWFAAGSCVLIFSSMLWSPFLMTLGMIFLVANALFSKNIFENFRNFFRSPELSLFTLVFFIYAASGLWSDFGKEWQEWFRIKLPFLALPVSFAALNNFSRKQLIVIFYSWIATFLIGAFLTILLIYFPSKSANINFSAAGYVPTPIDHIRFSIMGAVAAVLCISLAARGWFLFSRNEIWFQIPLSVFLILFIHMLAIRSGMAALDFALLLMAMLFLYRLKNKMLAAFFLVAIACIPFLAYEFIPAVKAKIGYMRYDLNKYFSGEKFDDLSDGGRIASIRAGKEILMEHPVLGAGGGVLKEAMNEQYERMIPPPAENRRLNPHNQWIFSGVIAGWIGVAVISISIFIPLFFRGGWKDDLVFPFCAIMMVSMMVEATLESQMGVALWMPMVFVLLNYKKEAKPD